MHFEVLRFIFSSEFNKIQSSVQVLLTLNITHETKANKECELTFTGGMMKESSDFKMLTFAARQKMLETPDLCFTKQPFESR